MKKRPTKKLAPPTVPVFTESSLLMSTTVDKNEIITYPTTSLTWKLKFSTLIFLIFISLFFLAIISQHEERADYPLNRKIKYLQMDFNRTYSHYS